MDGIDIIWGTSQLLYCTWTRWPKFAVFGGVEYGIEDTQTTLQTIL